MMRLFTLVVVIASLAIIRVRAFSSPLRKITRARPLFAASQTASNASRLKRVTSLTDWSKAVDIKLGGVDVEQSESGAGLGLLATQEVPSNSVVVSVPTTVALSVESPGDGVDDASVLTNVVEDRKAFRESPWYAQFSIYLNALDKISSQKQGIDMRPWLDSLPRSFDTPIHWNKAERDELQYKYLSDAVARQEGDWKKLYESLIAAGTPQLSKGMTFDDFVWGCECARSRAFSGGYTGSAFNPLIYAFTLLLVTVYVGLNLGTLEQAANGAAVVLCASILKDFVVPKLFKKRRYVICPVIDMANHKSVGTSGEVSFEFFGDAYSLATTSSVSKGSELYISYGTRSNDQLLQYYGFVENDNPHDVYVMPPLREWDIGALEAACGRQFAPGRLQKLERAGLLGSAASSEDDDSQDDDVANPSGGVVITRAGGIDPAVLQALRALVSTEEEWKGAGEAIGNFAEEYGPENERLARLVARTGIEKELESKPTTRQEDEALLSRASKGMEREEALALEFRIEKKKLLEEALENLK